MKYKFNNILPSSYNRVRKKMLENLISAPIWDCYTLILATIFLEVLALLDVRHRLQASILCNIKEN